MKSLLDISQKVLDIHPNERKAFGWTTGLMFLILFSEMLFANFADTAFIKRFGVEYLPEMFLIDAVLVFFVMDLLRGLVDRYSATTLLVRIFVIFALLEVLCRFLILLNFSLLYPAMYILRQQFDGVILIIFWNICNDMFDTRQSKRLFSLITAGGVLGRILGSFSTNILSQLAGLDNLLLFSAGLLLLGAMATRRIGELFPPPVVATGVKSSEKKGWSSPIAGLKEMSILAKGSLLFVLIAAIRVLPNVVGPMFDFQFSVILDQSFASEGGLINFYGSFRGILNILTFVVLLFVGAVYTRVGIPNALLFRPGNFFFVFSLLLFRFDILAGIYARLSINILTMTLHNPANNIIINLFPDAFRAKVRPILQIISRMGSLLGSLILLGLKAFIHASYFSVFGLFFVGIWIYVTLQFRRKYSSFLLESILEKQVDLRELGELDLTVLVQDGKTLNRLLEGLRQEKGPAATLCARILSEARYSELGTVILSVLPEKDLPIQIDLLNLLRPEDAPRVAPALVEMAEGSPPVLVPHLVRTVGRLAPGEHIDFLTRSCQAKEKATQAEGIVGLYQVGKGTEGYPVLSAWLGGNDPEELLLGITTVARTGELRFEKELWAILDREKAPEVQAKAIEALGMLKITPGDDPMRAWLKSSSPVVRRAAMSALPLEDDKALGLATEMLGDESADVRGMALEKIRLIGKKAVPSLIKALSSPKRELKSGVLRLLEELEVKDVEFSDFITREIRSSYENIWAVHGLETLEKTPGVGLLIRHLEDKNDDSLFTLFRILEVQGAGSEMRTIYRGVKAEAREKANALEALENKLHPALARLLVPLVEDIAIEEKVNVGEKHFQIGKEMPSDPAAILEGFLGSDDPVTQICALYAIGETAMQGLSQQVETLRNHPNSTVRETAEQALKRMRGEDKGERGRLMLSTMDKMIQLKKIYVFSDLQVRELAAISSVTVEEDHGKDEIIVKEGEPGDTMFLIISGEVSVIRNHGTQDETLIATIGQDDYFGEMALFEDKPRSATVKTNADSKLLVLGKLEFEEIMREFPQISINICRVFSQRIRELQRKFLS